jgi:threonine dehydrogenase-like Zn-dependent dehydrogenase
MGIVEEVGPEAARHLSVGDRVVVPFNISCGHCFMCEQGLQTQCETTQVRDEGMGAALLGYTKLYGHPPGIPAVAPGEVFNDAVVSYLQEIVANGAFVEGAVDTALGQLRVVADSASAPNGRGERP